MEKHTNNLNVALMYAGQGWRVLPLHSVQDGQCTCGKSNCNGPAKHPRIQAWQNNATTDEGQIRLWWQQWPDANIGIATGMDSNLVVIDIDPKGGGSIEAVEKINGGSLPETTVVRTGSGGWHLYFAYPRSFDVRNSAGELAQGVDVRGEGGYVVAPPSKHISGGSYRTVTLTSPAVLPIHLFQAIGRCKSERRSGGVEEFDEIPQGQRNNALFILSGKLRHIGLSRDEILPALKAFNKERCIPPLDESEVEQIADSIARYEPGEMKMPEGEQTTGPAIKSFADIMAMEIAEIRWTVPGILPEGLSILAGKPKMGKSWMVLELALAIGSGIMALGSKQVEQGDVLYLALEDNARRIQSRGYKLLGSKSFHCNVDVAFEWRRLDRGGSDDLREWIERHPSARLIIVDTLQMVRPLGKNNAVSYQEDYAAIRMLKKLSDEYHIAILVVHHLRKADADDPLDAMNGSTGLGGAADGYMILKRERGKADAVLIIGGRDIQDAELALSFDSNTCHWKLLGDAAAYRMNEDERKIIDLLTANELALSPKEIASRLGKDYDATRQMVSRMAKDGKIKALSRGMYTSVTTVTIVTNGSPSGLNGKILPQSPVTNVTKHDCDHCDECDDCDHCDRCDKNHHSDLDDVAIRLNIPRNQLTDDTFGF